MSESDAAPITEDLRALAAEVGQLYPAVYRRFHMSHQPVAGTDVTPRMLGTLHHLTAAGPLTLSELVLHLKLSKAATTELIDRLEARGLVARMPDERDRRRVFIWLTDAGRSRTFAHPQVLADAPLAQALARMSAADCAALVQGMRALLAAADVPADPISASTANSTAE